MLELGVIEELDVTIPVSVQLAILEAAYLILILQIPTSNYIFVDMGEAFL